MSSFTTRFAPAPTGWLHLGHVVNALAVWGYARSHGGRVLLRIEDHDRARCQPEYEASIHEDLAWLGFVPDAMVSRQSERGARYAEVLADLERTPGSRRSTISRSARTGRRPRTSAATCSYATAPATGPTSSRSRWTISTRGWIS